MSIDVSNIEQLVVANQYAEAIRQLNIAFNDIVDPFASQRLEQLKALCLSKLGDVEDAMNYFEPLWRSHSDRVESAGIMGSIYKSIFIANQDPKFGKLSAQTYLSSYQHTKNYYTGINAATMSKVSGDYRTAKEIANELISNSKDSEDDYWWEASLAEAYLLTNKYDLATEHYLKTRELMGNDWGSVASVNQQLWLINHFSKVPRSILQVFKLPTIAAFIGHMIDAPNREKPRFAPSMESDVRSAIRSTIVSNDLQVGFSSLACGADILFVEEMLELKREISIILPFNKNDFRDTSVAFAGQEWVDRFNNILERVSNVTYLTKDNYNGNDYFFQFLAEQIVGEAILRAKLQRSTPKLFAVISNLSIESKVGGTRDLLNSWTNKEDVVLVNTDTFLPERKDPDYYTGISTQNFELQKNRKFAVAISFSDEISLDELNFEDFSSLIWKGVDQQSKILVFGRFNEAIRFIRENKILLKNMEQSGGGFTWGLYNDQLNNVLDHQFIKDAVKLFQLSNKRLYTLKPVASIMAKRDSRIELEFAGEVELNNGEMNQAYRVNIS